ncbi:MAG: hypothetical protein PHG29_13230 [Prolixibacteraceae bacterium]|nr:hypothetical protein [Prolixibacteraceae bacterium]NLO03726.1 hypothetical protein [Bacteroidales bacterium]
MLLLAKAIYEHTSTGYIGSKENVNPGWPDTTSLIQSRSVITKTGQGGAGSSD